MPVTSYSHTLKRRKSEAMNPRFVWLVLGLCVLIAGGIFLATRDIPAPRHPVEKSIENERFFK